MVFWVLGWVANYEVKGPMLSECCQRFCSCKWVVEVFAVSEVLGAVEVVEVVEVVERL